MAGHRARAVGRQPAERGVGGRAVADDGHPGGTHHGEGPVRFVAVGFEIGQQFGVLTCGLGVRHRAFRGVIDQYLPVDQGAHDVIEHRPGRFISGGRDQFGQYTGNFPSPFREYLGFGKLSWQPIENQLVDFSGNYRYEHETRDFGGQTSFQSATDLKNAVYGGTLRDTWNNSQALNIATLSLQDYYWNPTPLNPNLPGMNFEGVIRIGGNSTTQKFDQQRLELRDDYSFAATQTKSGDHNLQAGFNADRMRYNINKSLTGNPEYDYRNDPANGFTFAEPPTRRCSASATRSCRPTTTSTASTGRTAGSSTRA